MFKPMLAATVDDASQVQYPVYASPKFDGVRMLATENQLLSRSLKPIPNAHVKRLFGWGDFVGLDGELVVGDPTSPDAFNKTSGAVRRADGEPDVKFYVFDYFGGGAYSEEWHLRHQRLCEKVKYIKRSNDIVLVEHKLISNVSELAQYEEEVLALRYEGVMLRSPRGFYKYGRSTVKEGALLKLKRFKDAEALIIGFEEQMHNTNEAQIDALGHAERSAKKEGLVGANTLGALIVQGVGDVYNKVQFNIGTGFDAKMRQDIWLNRSRYLGSFVKYKYFETGSINAPRFPVFLGVRWKGDL